MKNKHASRYSVQKSLFTKKVKTAEDNAVAYFDMMKEMTKEVDSVNATAHFFENEKKVSHVKALSDNRFMNEKIEKTKVLQLLD